MVVLSPFPDDPAEGDTAAEQVFDDALYHLHRAIWATVEPYLDDPHRADLKRRLADLARVVSLRVERHAPAAPQAAKNEAVIRGVGWIIGSSKNLGGKASESEHEGEAITWMPQAPQNWFRLSMAASVIGPWRRRG